ncbi:hypothetical protein AVEN_64452-1 [Araneus ventricosus]|uniref:Uncharacterized protein n=1 Tax=Araneus ventricosus TaxID=182803 RepID=A0A4Y2RBQ6_ARAVE|nr:hypothetical protein AVEN_64452-1 [Araneus ventricosus]
MGPDGKPLFQLRLGTIGLVILTSRFEATRGLFRDGPSNFEPRSDDEDDTRNGTPLSKLPRHTNGRTFGHYVGFSARQTPHTVDLQWNWVSNMEPSGRKAETLPLVHRCLTMRNEIQFVCQTTATPPLFYECSGILRP